eukprot:gene14922-18229_t
MPAARFPPCMSHAASFPARLLALALVTLAPLRAAFELSGELPAGFAATSVVVLRESLEARSSTPVATAAITNGRFRVRVDAGPGLFNVAERENGKAGWLLGASFITEGAIPFAAADPLRVIPSIMLGSAVTGGLSQAFDVSVRAPHGGIFVLFAVDGVLGFLIALVAGVLVGAAAVIALKSVGSREVDPATV